VLAQRAVTERTARRLAVVSVATFVALYLPVLDDFSWRHVDERLYTDAAIRMLEHGDLATPRAADGEPRFQKPLLTYWLLAASFRLCGIGLVVSRVPSLLAGVLLAWLTWRSALVWLREPAAALLAVVILLGHPETSLLATRAIPDGLLCVGLTACLLGVARLLVEDQPRPSAAVWAWAGTGIGVAAKGLPGLLGLAYGAAVLAANRGLRPLVRPVPIALGTTLAVPGLASPWLQHGVAAMRGLYDDQLARGLANSLGVVARNVGRQLGSLMMGILPWLALLAAGGGASVRTLGSRTRLAGFALGWVALLVGLAALPNFTRPRYVAPVLPPLAVLCGGVLAALAGHRDSAPRLRVIARGMLWLLAAAGAALTLAGSRVAVTWMVAGTLVTAAAAIALRFAHDDVAPLVALGVVVMLTGGVLATLVARVVWESPARALAECLAAAGPDGARATIVGEVGVLASDLRLASGGRLDPRTVPDLAQLEASNHRPALVVAPEGVARRLQALGWWLQPCGREVRAKGWTLAEWWSLVRSGDRERTLASQGRRFYVAQSGIQVGVRPGAR
jgi:4-amino-4-deoxy-L-arabinose transferase-like glycosyltransferase